MDSYLILKVTRDEADSKTIVVRPLYTKGKTVAVGGNLPEVYKGMIINLELDGSYVRDYELMLTDKNVNLLKKYDVDIAKYTETLEKHRKLKGHKCGWGIAEGDVDRVYDILPFPQADYIHKEIADDPTAESRLNCISHKVREMERMRRKIEYGIDEYLSCFDETEAEGAYERLSVMLKIMTLDASSYTIENGNVIDVEIKEMEKFIHDNLLDRLNSTYNLLTEEEIREYYEKVKDDGLEEEQLRVLWCMKNSAPCIVTGGAGVGKTSVIHALIDCYAMHYKVENILLIAPTGKASRRLAEKTGMAASTIHRALRKSPAQNYVYYTEDNPLPYRVIIIDESSMIDTSLMYDLMKAVQPDAKLIFVGDHNQLYPVGYGEPFFDFLTILEARDLVFRLTINHRQDEDTDILQAAENVLKGIPIFPGKGVRVECISYDDIGSILTSDKDTQIISPYNELNRSINEFLQCGEDTLNIGDKVMTIRNSDDYCNGDIGYITDFVNAGIVLDIDGRTVIVPEKDRKDIVLAYAITIHKMQGSECDRVIVFIPKGDRLVDRRMMYTAVTRARKELEVYYYDHCVESYMGLSGYNG